MKILLITVLIVLTALARESDELHETSTAALDVRLVQAGLRIRHSARVPCSNSTLLMWLLLGPCCIPYQQAGVLHCCSVDPVHIALAVYLINWLKQLAKSTKRR